MPIDLRAWLNPQPYSNSYSADGIAREAAYFSPVPEPVTADAGYIVAEAREYEDAGYHSATFPQSASWPDVTVTAAWALAHTERLTVALAHRPGTQAPTAAARALATLDRLSGGRTTVHLILGHERDLARDGVAVDRAARYRRAAEYLEVFSRTLSGAEPFDFDGEFYRLRGAYSGVVPVSAPRPVISTPAESDDALRLGLAHADVLAFQGTSRAEASDRIARARELAPHARPGFWINLNLLVGKTDAAARDHLARLEDGIRTLARFRARTAAGPASIRAERFADAPAGPLWQDEVLYLGLTALSRATPTLVGSPQSVADAVLGYYELGIHTVSLGSHVTGPRDAELRAETLRLIRDGAAARDSAAQAA